MSADILSCILQAIEIVILIWSMRRTDDHSKPTTGDPR